LPPTLQSKVMIAKVIENIRKDVRAATTREDKERLEALEMLIGKCRDWFNDNGNRVFDDAPANPPTNRPVDLSEFEYALDVLEKIADDPGSVPISLNNSWQAIEDSLIRARRSLNEFQTRSAALLQSEQYASARPAVQNAVKAKTDAGERICKQAVDRAVAAVEAAFTEALEEARHRAGFFRTKHN